MKDKAFHTYTNTSKAKQKVYFNGSDFAMLEPGESVACSVDPGKLRVLDVKPEEPPSTDDP